jgi:hypothetical protein
MIAVFVRRALAACLAAVSCEAFARELPRLHPDGTNDMTRTVLDAVHSAGLGGEVVLSEGTYHFYSSSAEMMDVYISNHDQDLPRRVQLPLRKVRGVAIIGLGKGAHFVFHGESTGILLMDSTDVAFSNISLDWAESPIGEAKITSFAPGGAPILDWTVRAFDGEGSARMLWDAETHSIKPGTGDVFEMSQAEVGDIMSFRSWSRPSPAVCLYRSRDVRFADVVVHSAHGMGLLAQRSANIAWIGGGVYPRKGCICSTKADATHFSNCRGKVSVSGALFEGMMDDAINVHSTCLRIEARLPGGRIRCRYVHPQAIGFEVFEPGERLRFIRSRTLENGPECRVVGVVREDERTVVLELDEAGAEALAGYGEGDAVENADWQPSVMFNGNTVRNNRARAALFTTPGKVSVIGNTFDRVSGSAILLAGDAANWYESGACREVEIVGNAFRNCLTSSYQFCTAVVAIAPTVPDLAAQKVPYHRNILIMGNVFDSPGAKSFDGVSVADVRFVGNVGVQ